MTSGYLFFEPSLALPNRLRLPLKLQGVIYGAACPLNKFTASCARGVACGVLTSPVVFDLFEGNKQIPNTVPIIKDSFQKGAKPFRLLFLLSALTRTNLVSPALVASVVAVPYLNLAGKKSWLTLRDLGV